MTPQILQKQLPFSIDNLPISLDPYQSCWVSASAGSGKTKILTDRVLSLLLYHIEPERILCLTFTKAAANEMRQRILSKASTWQTLSLDQLQDELTSLFGFTPDTEILDHAKQLFSILIEKIHSLKIQTIHSFAQSLLQQFPFEAGIAPNFQIIDEQNTQELIQNAIKKQLAHCYVTKNYDPQIALHFNAQSFQEKITSLIHTSPQFLQKMMDIQEKSAFETQLFENFNVDPDQTDISMDDQFWSIFKNKESLYRHWILIASQGTAKEQSTIAPLEQFLLQNDIQDSSLLATLFLTKEGEIRKKFLTQKLIGLWPEGTKLLEEEAQRVKNYLQQKNNLIFLNICKSFLSIALEIYKSYTQEKEQKAVLDYQDLILKTTELLQKPTIAPWILYKLDHQIDHILVDEAQDTNHLQWSILNALTDEFFDSQKTRPCSLFVVGDPKQSIYSFQGVDPKLFHATELHLKQKAALNAKHITNIKLDTCYRSAPSILKLVDAVFNQGNLPDSLGEMSILHKPARKDALGQITLFPIITPITKKEVDAWPIPQQDTVVTQSPRTILVDRLTNQIKNWLDNQTILPSTGLPIQPKDILILVRKRGGLMNEIVKSLKTNDIPIAGCDRLILLEELAIQDLLCFGEFCLHPYDDLLLAGLLKSPFFNWDDDQLLNFASRASNLWDAISTQCPDLHMLLNGYIQNAIRLSPFEFYTNILYSQKGFQKLLARLGHESKESIDAFISILQNYEKTHLSGLQGFIDWIKKTSIELKRELDDPSQNQTRIMTVHGAKGLQAPIVFLPDTISPPLSRQPDYITTDEGAPLLLKAEAKSNYLSDLKTKHLSKVEDEHARLLYVALTRAQDQLYIMGASNTDKINDLSWYKLVQRGIETFVEPESIESESTHYNYLGGLYSFKDDPFVPTQQNNVLTLVKPKLVPQRENALPNCADFSLPIRTDTIKKNTGTSPLNAQKSQYIGTKLHQLLHILPKIQKDMQDNFAQDWIEHQDIDLRPILLEFLPKVKNILVNPLYADFFGSHSYGEIPLMGQWKGQFVEGRIDRLVIQEDKITIIDFKTYNHELENYQDQLTRYATWLNDMYPKHKIIKALLVIETETLVYM
jgi:ATP-dependent helicase/nuclease subunit A